MKVCSVHLQNFASYEVLNFDFESAHGLALINGPTGSGKSTLCDAIPWILFGTTAKGGAVNEVLAWPGDKLTRGEVRLEASGVEFFVVRQRGPKAKDNDLYFTGSCVAEQHFRGKDLPDTQRLINERLGFTADAYLAGAYYHEFSPTAQFFVTNAKSRRQLCEQLVDLSLPKKLAKSITERRKGAENSARVATNKLEQAEELQGSMCQSYEATERRQVAWTLDQKEKINQARLKSTTFKDDRDSRLKSLTSQFHEHAAGVKERIAEHKEQLDSNMREISAIIDEAAEIVGIRVKLAALDNDTCTECGAPKHHELRDSLSKQLFNLEIRQEMATKLELGAKKLHAIITSLEESKNPYRQQIKDATQVENPFNALLKTLKAEVNPHDEALREYEDKIVKNNEVIIAAIAAAAAATENVQDLELLSDIVADFRSELVKNTIVGLETQTNKLLADNFDAEIRVTFDVQDADKIEVGITKDGNTAVFTQLSKGQRQILKLSFGVAVMKQVANHNGLNLSTVFFDEASDGLDELMKHRALKLLKSLESDYQSIFLVDHSESLKSMVEQQYVVRLEDGRSHIEKS